MRPRRPILRYHGGKWILAKWIISYFPPHRIYVEPFGGGASVLMQKKRSYSEVYNDRDGEIVNVFQVLRDQEKAKRLIDLLYLTPFARDEFFLSYEPTEDPVEQARRTIFRSFAGFGSAAVTGHITGFRSNSNRSGTVPSIDWANYPLHLREIIDRLRGVTIENKEAIELIKQHDTDKTLFYLDPPYPISTRMKGAHYSKLYRYEMNDEDHRTLASVIKNIRGMAIISGYPCDLYDKELYSDWMRVEKNAFADGASKRTEVLWISKRAESNLNLLW